MIDSLRQDVRYALRGLRRAPGFTFAAVLTLALGIGANTAIFSIVDGVVLSPLPFPHPERLVAIYATNDNADRNSISYPNFLDWQKQAQTFEALAAWRGVRFTMVGRGPTGHVIGQMVSASFFQVLGVHPLLGRPFGADDDQRGGRAVVLLGEDFWKRRFAADPHVVGQHLTLNGRDHTVIGVLPSSIRLRRSINDVFVPIGQVDDPLFYDRGVGDGTFGLGRIKAGVSLPQARAEMRTVMSRLQAEYPGDNANSGVAVVSLRDDTLGDRQATLLTLLGAVAFVLLIACANVINLMLVRGAARSRELAIRVAMGAGRLQLLRQVVLESVLLALAGGGAGMLLALWGTPLLLSVLPSALPAIADIRMNPRVLALTAGTSLVAGLLMGLVPAFRALRQPVRGALTNAARGAGGQRYRAQRTLVVSEVALTLVLLVGTGLMIRSLERLWKVDAGLDPNDVWIFDSSLSPEHASTPDRVRAALQSIDDRLAAIPAVQTASIDIGVLPFGDGSTSFLFRREDEPVPASIREMRETLFYGVGPDYFATMRIPLRRGRTFTRLDNASQPAVAVIDEEFAGNVFGGQNPIGQRIRLGISRQALEIVGVVGHVKHWGFDYDPIAPLRRQLYTPYAQLPDIIAPLVAKNVTVVVRSRESASVLVPAIRGAISAFDSGQAIGNERLMTDTVDAKLASRRFSMLLLATFAGVALLLSVIGIYGVVSYLVAQRTSEIGVRMAMGARPIQILRLVLGEGQVLAIVGILLGLASSLVLTRFIERLLFGVSATDPLTLASVATMLLAVTLAACYVPARRAMRVDPVSALRAE